VLGSLATRAAADGFDVVLVSPDKVCLTCYATTECVSFSTNSLATLGWLTTLYMCNGSRCTALYCVLQWYNPHLRGQTAACKWHDVVWQVLGSKGYTDMVGVRVSR
jgi:hypothetical protein